MKELRYNSGFKDVQKQSLLIRLNYQCEILNYFISVYFQLGKYQLFAEL